MDTETLRQKIEQLTGNKAEIKQFGRQKSASLFGAGSDAAERSIGYEESFWIPLFESEGRVTALGIERAELSDMNLQLAEFAAQSYSAAMKASGFKEEGEHEARQLSAWLNAQLEQDEHDGEIPDDIGLKSRLFTDMVPFLLVSENMHGNELAFRSLLKLVRSYFDSTALLVPLQEKEWLILARKELLTGSEEKDEDEATDDEELLAQACMGLHELIASEWVGIFHVSVSSSIAPVKGLPGIIALLRETISLGRVFQVGEYIHLPWELQLERLVNSIPDGRRRQLLAQFGDYTPILADKEMLTTLETFFEMDCNVSETAKKLYIHSNTLLYRLDKIKHETGADVRSFGDAAIVKLTMLLYKVTKRK